MFCQRKTEEMCNGTKELSCDEFPAMVELRLKEKITKYKVVIEPVLTYCKKKQRSLKTIETVKIEFLEQFFEY